MACRDCIWYSRCVLERRGICTDFKEKHGQSDTHKHAVGSQVTLEDGSQWEATYTIEMPLERFWLVEPATEDKVVFVRQLFNANGVKRDIRIEARKQDDSWTVTDAQVQSYSQPMIRIE